MKEIKKIVDEAYADTLKLIEKYSELIEEIANQLVVKGMMAGPEIDEIFKKYKVRVKKSATLTSCDDIASCSATK